MNNKPHEEVRGVPVMPCAWTRLFCRASSWLATGHRAPVSNTDINSWSHGELQAKLAEFGAPNMGEMKAFVDELCGGVWRSLSLAS